MGGNSRASVPIKLSCIGFHGPGTITFQEPVSPFVVVHPGLFRWHGNTRNKCGLVAEVKRLLGSVKVPNSFRPARGAVKSVTWHCGTPSCGPAFGPPLRRPW